MLAELRQRDRWLVVFDNASGPEGMADALPSGEGHVLITSRAQDWAEVAVSIEVDVLARAESVTILQNRVPGLGEADAGPVAQALGDLATLRTLAYDVVWYLIRRGDARSGYDLADCLYQHRLGTLGPDDPGTLNAAPTLARSSPR